jgi:hypothetical protein
LPIMHKKRKFIIKVKDLAQNMWYFSFELIYKIL